MKIFIHDLSGLFGFFDPRTGEVTGLGDFGQTITDAAYMHDGSLYAIDFDSLYLADPATGTLEFVRELPVSQANSLSSSAIPEPGTGRLGAFVASGDGSLAQFYLDTGEAFATGSLPGDWRASGDVTGYIRDDGVFEWIVAAQRGGGLIGPTHAFVRYIFDLEAPYDGTSVSVRSEEGGFDYRVVTTNHNVANLWGLAESGAAGAPFFGFAGSRAYEFELDPLSVREIADLSGYGFVQIAGASRVIEPFPSPDANRPPVVEGASAVLLTTGEVVAAPDFVEVSDPDGPEDIDFVRFWDATPGTDGGFLTLDGDRIGGSFVDVALDELARVAYRAGPEAGSNAIVVEAFDRAGATSGDFELEFTIEEDALPELHRPTTRELEFMARVVAYGHQTELSGLGWNIGGYEVRELFLEPGRTGADPGFLAVALTSPQAEPILAIRGTAGGDDWIDNLNPQGVGVGQVELVWDRIEAWIGEQADASGRALPIHLTGHSQGGAQAQFIASLAAAGGTPLGKVVTFNSPGLPAGDLDRFGVADALAVRHFVSSSDPVSLVGESYLPGKVVLYSVDLPEVPPFGGLRFVWNAIDHLQTSLGGFVMPAHTGHWAQPGMEAQGFFHSAITREAETGLRVLAEGFDALTLAEPTFGYHGFESPHADDGLATRLDDARFPEFVFAFRQGLVALADWALQVTAPFHLFGTLSRLYYGLSSDQFRVFRDEAQEIRDFTQERDFLSRADWTDGAALLGGSELFQWASQEFLRFEAQPDPDLVTTVDPDSGTTTIIYEGSDPGVLISSAGVVEMYSFAPGSAFFAGPQSETITMTGGGNKVIGNVEQLDGDTIRGFGETDLFHALDAAFGMQTTTITGQSAVIAVDANADGTKDMTLRLEGEYDLAQFGVLPAPDGTAIFYRTPPSDLVASVTVTATDRTGAPLPEVALHLDRPFGTVKIAEADAEGAIVFDALLGTEGHLRGEAELTGGAAAPQITTASALEALRLAVGLSPSWGPADAMDYIAADFDGDGQVTTADALGILRTAVGLTAEQAPRWLFLDAAADLSEVDRSNTQVDPGLRLDPITGSIADLSLTVVFVGHVQEYV